jgi:hypothetical protein
MVVRIPGPRDNPYLAVESPQGAGSLTDSITTLSESSIQQSAKMFQSSGDARLRRSRRSAAGNHHLQETRVTTVPTLRPTAAVGAAMAILLAGCGGSDGDQATTPPPALQAADVCAKLSGRAAGGSTALAAAMVPASGPVPTHCKVTGTIPPQLNFEMAFPDSWNGKLHYGGGGGMNGAVPPLSGPRLDALSSGYVAVASDGGHAGSIVDASFALNDSLALDMWGHLAIPTVAVAAKGIAELAYGKRPERSYFEGCSTGGREGLMMSQRYPEVFDGIVAGAPSYNIVGLMSWWGRSFKQMAVPGGALSEQKLKVVSDAALAACDGLDGITDGLVSNPAACTTTRFNPSSLRCADGADSGSSCLSDAQLASLDALTSRSEVAGAPGLYSHAGVPLTGIDHLPSNLPGWQTGRPEYRSSIGFLFYDSIVRNIIARDPALDALTYQFSDLNALFSVGGRVNATNPDIRGFVNRGGKLLLWHGGSDAAYPAENTADYYRKMAQTIGATATESSTRFYVHHGVAHCSGGVSGGGDRGSNHLQVLDDWVTKGIAPQVLVGRKLDAQGREELTRPLCRYPEYPRYTGPANNAEAARLASNYTCTNP